MPPTRRTDIGVDRRSFLRTAGLSGVVLAAGSAVLPLEHLVSPAFAQAQLDDPTIAAFLESIELAAVEVYDALGSSGKVTTAATVPLLAQFSAHHKDHAGQIGVAAGSKATHRANPTLTQTFRDQITAARNEEHAVSVAYNLESNLTSTYLYVLGLLKDTSALKLSGSILPVESQHAVILGKAIGKTPSGDSHYVPNLLTEDQKIDPAKFPVA